LERRSEQGWEKGRGERIVSEEIREARGAKEKEEWVGGRKVWVEGGGGRDDKERGEGGDGWGRGRVYKGRERWGKGGRGGGWGKGRQGWEGGK